MGEVADDIINGIMCQVCGVWMPEIEKYWGDHEKMSEFLNNPPGYPRTCPDCVKDAKREKYEHRSRKQKKKRKRAKNEVKRTSL